MTKQTIALSFRTNHLLSDEISANCPEIGTPDDKLKEFDRKEETTLQAVATSVINGECKDTIRHDEQKQSGGNTVVIPVLIP